MFGRQSPPGQGLIDRIGTALLQKRVGETSPPSATTPPSVPAPSVSTPSPRQPFAALHNALKRTSPLSEPQPEAKRVFQSQTQPFLPVCSTNFIVFPKDIKQEVKVESADVPVTMAPHLTIHTIPPVPPAQLASVVPSQVSPSISLVPAAFSPVPSLQSQPQLHEPSVIFTQPPPITQPPSVFQPTLPNFYFEESPVVWSPASSANSTITEDPATTSTSNSPPETGTPSLPSEPIPYQGNNDTDTFCSVPSRLSLLNSSTKYQMSIAEVKRRIGWPECLNVSLLGGIMRRAKSKHGGADLRQELETRGIKVPPIRRRTTTMNLLTALTEAEAAHLVRDFKTLSEAEFPTAKVVEHLNHDFKEAHEEGKHRRLEELARTREILSEFMNVLRDDKSPLLNLSSEPVLPAEVQTGLDLFSKFTHGFGTPAILVGLEAFARYLEAATLMVKGEPAVVQPIENVNNNERLPAASSVNNTPNTSTAGQMIFSLTEGPKLLEKPTKRHRKKKEVVKMEPVEPQQQPQPVELNPEDKKNVVPVPDPLLQLQMFQMLANNPTLLLHAQLLHQAMLGKQ